MKNPDYNGSLKETEIPIYTPDWLLSDRLNKLIETGKVKYYKSLNDFKNRAK